MPYTPQYTPIGPQILAIAEDIKRRYPEDWKNAHNHQPSGEVYIRRVAWAVQQAHPALLVGLNGKRGNVHDLSQDVLCFPNATGAPDASDTYPGLEIRDIIASAGTPQASLYWGDVTQATLDKGEVGAWVKPEPVDDEEEVPEPPVEPCEPEVVIPPFPPRDETMAFGLALNSHYAQKGNGDNGTLGGRLDVPTPIARHTDYEGEVVWTSEYLRRRQLGETHQDATAHVLADVDAAWPK